MNIKLELSVEDINFILGQLGELPSKTGAFVLMMKIKEQADPQVPQEPKAEDGQPTTF
jgi:hypothetical protein